MPRADLILLRREIALQPRDFSAMAMGGLQRGDETPSPQAAVPKG